MPDVPDQILERVAGRADLPSMQERVHLAHGRRLAFRRHAETSMSTTKPERIANHDLRSLSEAGETA